MEATLPLTALQRQQHLALTVQIAVPLWVFGVGEVAPGVVVDALKPLQALLVARQLVALEQRDECLDVYPPQLLVKLQLVAGLAQAVHEVEDALVLLVPAVFHLGKRYLHRLVDKLGAVKPLPEVHQEPCRLDGMTGVHLATVEAVHQFAVLAQSLYYQAELRLIEHVHHLVDAVLDGLLQEGGVNERLYLQSHVAEYHRQVEGLQSPRSRRCLVPAALGIVHPRQHYLECLAGYVGIFLTARRYAELAVGNGGKGVGEDVVRLHQRMALTVDGEVPVVVAVVTVFLQELGPLHGAVQPFLPLLHRVVELGKHPHLPALQPDKFIGIIHAAVAVQAGEVAPHLVVLRVVKPEGQHLVKQLRLVLLR